MKKTDDKYIIASQDEVPTIIKKGKHIPVRQKRTQLLDWDLTTSVCDGNEYAYTGSFSSNKEYVQLNYQSLGINTFRIVKHHYFRDDEKISYASSVGRTPSGESKCVTLNLISGKEFDDVQLRIHSNDDGSRTFGEIYAY